MQQSLPYFCTVIGGRVKLLSNKEDYLSSLFKGRAHLSTEALHDLVMKQIPKVGAKH